MKILLFLVLVTADALPPTHYETSMESTESSTARNLCEICRCTNVDVFCKALHDPSLLLHYDGPDVESLSIYDSHLTNLREEHFAKFTNIKDLSLISNDLVINSTELGLLQDITILNLQGNSLTSFTNGMFDGNANLIKLNVGKNKIAHVANGTFPELRRLTALRLDHNHISGLELQALCGLPALEELDLSHNFLDHVDAAWFDPLPRLQTLRLEHNKVAVLDPALVQLAMRRALVVSLAGNPVRCACGPVRETWLAAQARALPLNVTCANGQPWGEALAPLECGSAQTNAHTAPGSLSPAPLEATVVYAIWAIVALCLLLSIVLIIVIVTGWKKSPAGDNTITFREDYHHYEALT